MSKKVVVIFFLAAVLAVLPGLIPLCGAAYAQASKSECWAVIIGVSDYERIDDLPYSDDDARELSQLLSPVWGEGHIKLLLDSQASKANILATLDWLAEKEDADDSVLFYFSGRGGGGYIHPYDAYYTATLLSAGELNSKLNRLDSKRMTVILDAGNAGQFESVLGAGGRVILMGCRSNEIGWVSLSLRHGYFTNYVLQALKSFDEADANHDYELSAEEVFRYAEPKTVSFSTERFNQKQITSIQHPVLSDGYSGELGLLVKFAFSTKPSLPSGTEVLVLDDKPYTSVPSSFTWVPGSAHSLKVPSLVAKGSSTRYVFTSWNDGDTSVSRTVSRGVYTANYNIEHLLTINSAYGEPKGAGWYKEGEAAGISVTALIEEPATKHIFTGWSGDFTGTTANATLTMNSPKVVTANWRNEYLLTITSPYGESKGAGWYKEGETANISVTTVEGVIIRHIFTGWSGDFTRTTANATLTMNSPKAVTANWRTDYIQLYILIGGVVVLVAVIVAIIVVLRKRRKRVVMPEA